MYDEALRILADYVDKPPPFSQEAYQTAQLCLADALGCAILSLQYPACTKLLGPVVPDTVVPHGSRIPGTAYICDPIRAAFNIGTMIRWLDYNDTWLAAEWGHPSDNIGALLAIADFIKPAMTVKELLGYIIQAYEIQGILALGNSFNRIGLDHVILVKVASAAVTAKMMGATHSQILDTLSNAWIDLGPLRTYRHAPNAGSRKSWAAGDATSRGLSLAWLCMQGEMGYPTALTAKKWGLYDVLFQGKPLLFQRPLGSYVIENILFKVAFPAEFHAQTAVEAAIQLHPSLKGKWEDIDKIFIYTHESALRIIDKKGPLHHPADRDHCLQYMVAIALIYGDLTAEHYEDGIAQDPRIDRLRQKMELKENFDYSKDYLDPDKRSIANALEVRLKGGKILGPIVFEYPLGHKRRRKEGIPLLYKKFNNNMRTHFSEMQTKKITNLFLSENELVAMKVTDFVSLFTN